MAQAMDVDDAEEEEELDEFAALQAGRKRLPIFPYREEIIQVRTRTHRCLVPVPCTGALCLWPLHASCRLLVACVILWVVSVGAQSGPSLRRLCATTRC